MSSLSREWSWEPRVPIYQSLLEITSLRIPSPAPDSPEYSCQGSEESSFSGDESYLPRELGEGDALCMSGVMSSLSREWSWDPRVPIYQSLLEITPLRIPSPAPDSPEYSCQGSEESSFSGDESYLPRELGEGDSLCMSGRGVISYASEEGATSRGSPDVSCPELELSYSSFLSVRGGGSDRFHGPDDDDVRSYVDSEEAGLQTPPLPDLTGIPSLDETGMTKGRRLQLPSGAFARWGRGRRGAGGRGRPDSPDRVRVNTRDPEDRDRRSSRDAEDRLLGLLPLN
ncbi:hypothetical protein Dimus_005948 [Dionaea muscipula]